MGHAKGDIRTVFNPAGFVEQKYVGDQTAASVLRGRKQLERCAKKLLDEHKDLLILIDITELGKTDTESRIAGVRGIKSVPYERAAMYGSLSTQVLVNTLALVAGKKDNTRAFSDRTEALKWLLGRRS